MEAAFVAGIRQRAVQRKAHRPQTETANAFAAGSKPIGHTSKTDWSQRQFELHNQLMAIAPLSKFPWQLHRAPKISNQAKCLWMHLYVCRARRIVLLDYVDNPHSGFFGILSITVIDGARFNAGPFPVPSQYAKGPDTFLHKYAVVRLWRSVGMVEAGPRYMRYSQKHREGGGDDQPPSSFPMMHAMAVAHHVPADTPSAVAIPTVRDAGIPFATVVATISSDGTAIPVGSEAVVPNHTTHAAPTGHTPRPTSTIALLEAHETVCRAEAGIQRAFAQLRHAHMELARVQACYNRD